MLRALTTVSRRNHRLYHSHVQELRCLACTFCLCPRIGYDSHDVKELITLAQRVSCSFMMLPDNRIPNCSSVDLAIFRVKLCSRRIRLGFSVETKILGQAMAMAMAPYGSPCPLQDGGCIRRKMPLRPQSIRIAKRLFMLCPCITVLCAQVPVDMLQTWNT